VGTCEFVVRLLARVTGERRGARYVWHKMLVGTVPEKKNMEKEERKKKVRGADFKKNSVFGGLWFVDSCFSTRQRWRYDVQGGHGAEKRCAAHVMRGPRSCSVVSAGDLSGP
jgi:hypothetical protein